MNKSFHFINAIVLKDDELLIINGGQNEVICGAGCGVGGCGEGSMGCQPKVEYQNRLQCGAACLFMVCRYYGMHISLDEVDILCAPTKEREDNS